MSTSFKILTGDVLKVLATLPAESVHCVVTSPPYWGLRDYGTGKWEGGDAECDHKLNAIPRTERPRNGLTDGLDYMQAKDAFFKELCGKCGATRIDQQIGLESTPELYVAKMVEVFREVRRVLRDDGTLWLNLGDSYNGSGPSGGPGKQYTNKESQGTTAKKVLGLKPKDLVGIPWMVAFALRADGWYLRSDIIWHKPNSMPESVTDRPTKSHEYMFLLTKSAKYSYDAEAIKEETITREREREKGNGESAVDTKIRGFGSHCGTYDSGRNKRTVWTIPTQPYSEAHFATFPEKLVEPCIRAGASDKCCSKCGAPWERLVESVAGNKANEAEITKLAAQGVPHYTANLYATKDRGHNITLGFQPSCACGGESVPGVVLDPFCGSGTTGLVALKNGCSFIGVELNPEYVKLAENRIGKEFAQPRFFF